MADNLDDDLEWLIGETDFSAKKDTIVGDSSPEKEHDDLDVMTDEDDEDDGLTPEERELLQRNTLLNDASDREEYDLKVKLKKANDDLGKTNGSKESRKVKVMFRQKLVDIEAPPIDYTSTSSSSSDSESENENRDNEMVKDEETSKDNTSKSERLPMQSMLSDDFNKSKVKFTEKDFEPAAKEEPKFKPEKASSSSLNEQSVKRMSLPVPSTRNETPRNGRPGSASRNSEYDHIKSPYAMSPEMKDLMQKRAEAKDAYEEEENAQRLLKEKEARENAELAWKCWVEKKNSDMRERKKTEPDRNQKMEEEYRNRREAEEAYELWLKDKRKKTKEERIYQHQQKLEYDEGWYRRDRKECNKAFKEWLQKKNRESHRERAASLRAGQQINAHAYQMKKLRRLLRSIQSSRSSLY